MKFEQDILMPVRVLMIDDDEEDCEIIAEYLRDSPGDYELETETNVARAVDRMMEGAHDVYLLDHRMGATKGVDLLGQLREKGFHKPVVLCSGDVDRDAKMDATFYGVSDIINKSTLSPTALDISLKYALSRGDRTSH